MKPDLLIKSTVDKEIKRKNKMYFESLKKDVIKLMEDKNKNSIIDNRKNFKEKEKL